METCYKVFKTGLLKSIPIRSNRFGFEPEITMKCAKRRLRIYEVPISYHGRTYEEGKKIGWWDGVKALAVILRFWLIDDLYVSPHGRGTLITLTRTPAYVRWIVSLLRPHLGDQVLEIGASTGTFSAILMGRRLRYVAAECDPFYLHALQNRFLRTPNVEVMECDPGSATSFGWEGEFDTAICLNVLEGVEDPAVTLKGLRRALGPGGRLLLLAPLGPGLYGSIDSAMGQRRRFDQQGLRSLLADCGFVIERAHQVNKVGRLAWWFSSRVLRSARPNKLTLKLFDKTVWLWRLLDPVLPWPGLSWVVAARRRD
jgi:SAM-dependent methyltransferase